MPKKQNAEAIRFTVKVGSTSIPVSQYTDGRYFFRRKVGGVWKTVVRVSKEKITTEAKATAKLMSDQKAALIGISAGEIHEFIAWKVEKSKSVPLREALADYTKAKLESGIGKHHEKSIKALTKILFPLSDKNIRAITSTEIEQAVPRTYSIGKGEKRIVRQMSGRRLNNIFDDVSAFFAWCRKKKILPEGVTAAESVDRQQESAPSKEFYSLEELKGIEAQISDKWLAWFGIASFAGLRSEELQKLEWENLILDRAMIDISAKISKTKRRRLVPIPGNLMALLRSYGEMSGPICPGRIDNYTRSLRGWKKNGPRHSFGSYRMAVIQNAPQLAEEMGNSIPMIKKHYVEAVFPDEGREYFSYKLNRRAESSGK